MNLKKKKKIQAILKRRKIEQKISDTQVNIINNLNYKPLTIVYRFFLLEKSTF